MFAIRLKLSLVTAAFALLIVAAAYIFSLWTAERKKSDKLPVEAASMLMRDLLRYHEKRGGFPEDLKSLEGVVWDQKPRAYSAAGRALNYRNYYYFYSRLTPHQFTLWAIPTGPRREDSPTTFLIVTPETHRRFKGPAMESDQLLLLTPNPTDASIAIVGLVEQTAVKTNPNSAVRPR